MQFHWMRSSSGQSDLAVAPLVTVFPCIPLSAPLPGPCARWATLISGEAVCTGLLSHLSWEDSYLLRSTAFGAVDCKRRNFRLEKCGRPCLHGVWAGCSNALPDFLKALQTVRTRGPSPQVSDASRLDRIGGSRRPRRECWECEWGPTLSAEAEGLTLSVGFHGTEIQYCLVRMKNAALLSDPYSLTTLLLFFHQCFIYNKHAFGLHV